MAVASVSELKVSFSVYNVGRFSEASKLCLLPLAHHCLLQAALDLAEVRCPALRGLLEQILLRGKSTP